MDRNNELDSFFEKLFVIEQEYNIIPQKKHRGLAIKYIDMLERREEFIDELINNVVSWVYGDSKYNKLKKKFIEEEHRTESNANTKILQLARNKFNTAFEEAINSIIRTYETHTRELDLYIYEDYIENEYQEVAEKYKNCNLENVEIHLVNIIIYNETEKIDKSKDIKQQIESIIKERYEKFDFSKIDEKNPIVQRINYIIFPIWEFSKLLDKFFENL